MNIRKLQAICLLISVTIIILYNINIHPWILDDAFISFRYAQNLVSGQGLVFNAGERVEGYTCFLWVMLITLTGKAGLDMVFASRLLGFIFGFGCLALLLSAGRFLKGINREQASLAVLFLGTCGVFVPWFSSGMEVTLFAFLILLAIMLYGYMKTYSETRLGLLLTGFICALMMLTRPEGAMVFGVIMIDCFWSSLKRKNLHFVYLLIPVLALYMPYYIWRFSYYGYPLPNSFYAKVGFTLLQLIRGARYVLDFSLIAFPYIVLIFFLLFGFIAKLYRAYLYIIIILAVYSLYIVAVGGDCMPAFRFFAPVMPLACLLAGVSLSVLVNDKKSLIILALFIAAFNILQMRLSPRIYYHIREDKVAFRGKETGLWLKENAKPGAVIALNAAGSVPYYSGLKTIDMLGINDEHIAHRRIDFFGEGAAGHEKGDGAYVLARRPDFILLDTSYGSVSPYFLSDLEIYRSPEFHHLYELKIYALESGDTLWLYEKSLQDSTSQLPPE